MSKAKVTLTQKKIKQELLRRCYEQKKTTQSEYLKFQCLSVVLWIGRKGEIREGRRLPTSRHISLWPAGAELKRAAKANYQEETTK